MDKVDTSKVQWIHQVAVLLSFRYQIIAYLIIIIINQDVKQNTVGPF